MRLTGITFIFWITKLTSNDSLCRVNLLQVHYQIIKLFFYIILYFKNTFYHAFQIAAIRKTSKFEDEIKEEQENRKREEEDRKKRQQSFKDRAALFGGQGVWKKIEK